MISLVAGSKNCATSATYSNYGGLQQKKSPSHHIMSPYNNNLDG